MQEGDPNYVESIVGTVEEPVAVGVQVVGGVGVGVAKRESGWCSDVVAMPSEEACPADCGMFRGPYLGDVSALCFLPTPSLPLLLAGTGPQILLYDLATGNLLLSQRVFDGVRVHGIHVRRDHPAGHPELNNLATVVVHGEGRVKVFKLQVGYEKKVADFNLCIEQSLPRFFQWVLDVKFLQEESSLTGGERQDLVAVGLSDNSVSIWNVQKCSVVLRVECSERCLLYSLRLWGSSIKTLCVAAGTIFNKVLIWDANCWNKEEKEQQSLDLSRNINSAGDNKGPLAWTAEPLQELLGHEGSIHRISWSEDGLCFASASDDRSARIWSRPSTNTSLFTCGPVLYGHGARLWDCQIADNLLITASEDCTSRVWTRQGHHLATLTGHTGRGIWRCEYNHQSDILVTAGADSAIKVQSLAKWSHEALVYMPEGTPNKSRSPAQASLSNLEILRIPLIGPNVLGEGSSISMDSNSEYVRCLHLAGPTTLYVATNQGHGYHVALSDSAKQDWTEITHGEISGPIVCMDLLVDGASVVGRASDEDKNDEMVVFGNGSGIATALGVRILKTKPTVVWQCKWLADRERQLLGVFWCKSLGRKFVFTTDPRGLVRVWLLERCLEVQASVEEQDSQMQALLIASYQSSLQFRIVCLDVCPLAELLVCGDQRGNLVLFHFPELFLESHIREDLGAPLQLHNVGVFKGAHGISPVASVYVESSNNSKDAIVTSTGRDGCICKFLVDTVTIIGNGESSSQSFACTGVEDVSAITVVESVERRQDQRKCKRRLAAGFIASNFILWDLTQHSELMRVACGGWRRPHSYVVGDVPEHQCCFAFLKDHIIYVHRNWANVPLLPDSMGITKDDNPNSIQNLRSQLPQSLHGQFHGREIHSVQFVPAGSTLMPSDQHVRKVIATGSEDGAVRISRYDAGMRTNLESFLMLGEHTGGSAVRALTLVHGAQTYLHHEPPSIRTLDARMTDPILLLSVGAKEVLTCWLLEWKLEPDSGGASVDEVEMIGTVSENNVQQNSVTEVLSSRWLCSYSPHIFKPRRKEKNASKVAGKQHVEASAQVAHTQKKLKQLTEGSAAGANDVDDLRFLAVTALSVYSLDIESVFCFVVTASSNATLRLLGMNLTTRTWVEVAVLEHHKVPVLALQHLVVPMEGGRKNMYLIISGATDGSIAVWDITSLVLTFTRQMLSEAQSLAPSKETQLRPRTGRGSQGGRRSRSKKQWQAGLSRSKKNLKVSKEGVEREVDVVNPINDVSKERLNSSEGTVPDSNADHGAAVQVGDLSKATETFTYQPSALYPFCTFTKAHQSGVNCLSVATVTGKGESEIVVVSGGDDQSLHVLRFELIEQKHHDYVPTKEPSGDDMNILATSSGEGLPAPGVSTPMVQLAIDSIHRVTVHGAHSSAVKGIWTDGAWVFSTGLDQRLRCWRLSDITTHCESSTSYQDTEDSTSKSLSSLPSLLEYHHCVIDVPEAENLHVESTPNRGQYCISVVGRGLQVFNFVPKT